MRRGLKTAAAGIAALAVLAAAAARTGLQTADQRMQRKVEVAVRPVAWTTDAAASASS